MRALVEGQADREAARQEEEEELAAKVERSRARREQLQATVTTATSRLSGDINAVDELIQARLREQEAMGSGSSALASWTRMDEMCVHSQQRVDAALQELTNQHSAAS